MHRSTVLGITFTALFCIAASLLAASLFLQPGPGAVAGSFSPATATAVRAFYAAANEVIATGQTARLEAVVAPHFDDKEPLPGVGPGREGIIEYLLTLHAIDPTLQIVPEPIVAADDRAIAVVTLQHAAQRQFLAGAVAGDTSLWSPVDVFRVAGDRIVERTTRTEGLGLVRPLALEALVLGAPAPRHVTLTRARLDAGAVWRQTTPGPRFLYLETGSVRGDGVSPSGSTTLGAGRSLLVPTGTSLELANLGSGPADLLIVSLRVPGASADVPPTVTDLPLGVTAHVLAGDLGVSLGSGPVTLELGQVILGPRARLDISSAGGPAWIAVDAGEAHLTAQGRVWIRDGSDGMSSDRDEATLRPGDGAVMHVDSHATLQNGSEAPVTALVLTLRALG